MRQTEIQAIRRSIGAALGAATGAALGNGTGAYIGAACGQGFGVLLDDQSIATLAAASGDALASSIVRILGECLEARERGFGPRRPPIMAGRLASAVLREASKVFVDTPEDPDRAISKFWVAGLAAAAGNATAYLNVFGAVRQWDDGPDEWRRQLAIRLWSPARMENLAVHELTSFLMHLPENPDLSGMSWPDLQAMKSETAKARAVPHDRRRLLLTRNRDLLAGAMRRGFTGAIVEDREALSELACLSACFKLIAAGAPPEGAESAVEASRRKVAALAAGPKRGMLLAALAGSAAQGLAEALSDE